MIDKTIVYHRNSQVDLGQELFFNPNPFHIGVEKWFNRFHHQWECQTWEFGLYVGYEYYKFLVGRYLEKGQLILYTFLFFIVDVDITFPSASPTSSAKSLTTWQRWQAVRSAGLGRNGRPRRDTHAVRCAGDGFTFDNPICYRALQPYRAASRTD